MASTLTVTVHDTDGSTVAYGALVRLYSATEESYGGEQFPFLQAAPSAFVAEAMADSSGVATFDGLSAGQFLISVEPHRTGLPTQWIYGPSAVGSDNMTEAGTVAVDGSTDASVTVRLRPMLSDAEMAISGYTFWKDTSDSGAVLRLYPGEERRPMAGDLYDPLYKHVLAGPFDTYAKAAAS